MRNQEVVTIVPTQLSDRVNCIEITPCLVCKYHRTDIELCKSICTTPYRIDEILKWVPLLDRN